MMRFQSSAAGDVQMFTSDAGEMLKAMGHPDRPQGALLPEDLPAAVAALEAAVQHSKAQPPVAVPATHADETLEQRVDFGRRAWPLMELLRLSAERQVAVTWGL